MGTRGIVNFLYNKNGFWLIKGLEDWLCRCSDLRWSLNYNYYLKGQSATVLTIQNAMHRWLLPLPRRIKLYTYLYVCIGFFLTGNYLFFLVQNQLFNLFTFFIYYCIYNHIVLLFILAGVCRVSDRGMFFPIEEV